MAGELQSRRNSPRYNALVRFRKGGFRLLSPMSEFLYKSVETLGSRIKGRPFHLDRNIPVSLLLGLLIRRVIWLVRGVLKLLFLQRRVTTVFMAKGVNLRAASLIR